MNQIEYAIMIAIIVGAALNFFLQHILPLGWKWSRYFIGPILIVFGGILIFSVTAEMEMSDWIIGVGILSFVSISPLLCWGRGMHIDHQHRKLAKKRADGRCFSEVLLDMKRDYGVSPRRKRY